MSIEKKKHSYYCSNKYKDNDKVWALLSHPRVWACKINKFGSTFICNETGVLHITQLEKQLAWIAQNFEQFNNFWSVWTSTNLMIFNSCKKKNHFMAFCSMLHLFLKGNYTHKHEQKHTHAHTHTHKHTIEKHRWHKAVLAGYSHRNQGCCNLTMIRVPDSVEQLDT